MACSHPRFVLFNILMWTGHNRILSPIESLFRPAFNRSSHVHISFFHITGNVYRSLSKILITLSIFIEIAYEIASLFHRVTIASDNIHLLFFNDRLKHFSNLFAKIAKKLIFYRNYML